MERVVGLVLVVVLVVGFAYVMFAGADWVSVRPAVESLGS